MSNVIDFTAARARIPANRTISIAENAGKTVTLDIRNRTFRQIEAEYSRLDIVLCKLVSLAAGIESQMPDEFLAAVKANPDLTIGAALELQLPILISSVAVHSELWGLMAPRRAVAATTWAELAHALQHTEQVLRANHCRPTKVKLIDATAFVSWASEAARAN